MRPRRSVPGGQLGELADRLLKNNQSEEDVPVIVSTREGDYRASVGRLLHRAGARVSAMMDVALEGAGAVTVFLSGDAYVGEVVRCEVRGTRYAVELALIMSQAAESELERSLAAFAART